MNFLAHGYRWLDRPYFLAGTALPDWVAVADRSLRVRIGTLRRWCDRPEPVAEVARGMIQHLRDDAVFHSNPVFVRISAALTTQVSAVLGGPRDSFVPAFLGHLLTELLLDATIAGANYGLVSRYYQVLASIPPEEIERIVVTIAGQPTSQLAPMIRRFLAAQVLWDYLDDRALLQRVNQVLRRVGLQPVSDRLSGILPAAREFVHEHRDGLLAGVSGDGDRLTSPEFCAG